MSPVAGVAIFALFFQRALSPSVFLFRRDAFRLYLPIEAFISQQLRAHRLPTWYPFDGLGVSLVGSSIAGLLHPRHLLLLALSPDQALKWTALLAFAFAGLGTWLLARQLGASPPGRMLAALGYGLSGYLLSMSDNPPYLLSAAVLPWVALAAERLSRTPSRRAAALLGLALALGAWSGDVQGALLQDLLAVAVVLRRGVHRDRIRGLAIAATLELCWLAPLLPAIAALAKGSGRLGGVDPKMALSWSLPPIRLFEVAFGAPWPAAFIDDAGQGFAARYLTHEPHGVWAASVFVGTAICALSVVAAVRSGPRHRRTLWAVVAVIAIWLSLGSHAGLYRVLWRHLPLWSAFRYPAKLMPFFVLAVSVLGALGLRGLRGRRLTVTLAVMALVTMALAAAAHGSGVARILVGLDPARATPAADIVRGTLQSLCAALAVSAVVLLGLTVASWRRGRWLWLVPALQLVQALPLAGWVVRTGGVSWLDRRSPFAEQARARQGPGRICEDASNFHYRVPPQKTAQAVTMGGLIDALAPDHAARAGVRVLPGYAPGFPGLLHDLCAAGACGTACSRLLGAQTGVADGARFDALRADGAGLQALARIEDPALVLFADPRARPFAEPVAVHFVPTDADIRAAVDATADPPTAAVVLLGSGADAPAPPGAVSATRPRPDVLSAEVHLGAPGWVVIREDCARGWTAAIDGARVALAQADEVFCAVHLPAGDHHLLLRYEPPGWPWTFALYALAWLGALALAWPRGRHT